MNPPIIFPIKQNKKNEQHLINSNGFIIPPTVKYMKLLVSNSEFVNTINTKAKLNAIAPNKLTKPSLVPANCVLIANINTVTIANKNPDMIAFNAYLPGVL